MISKDMNNKLNGQIIYEFYSSYLYRQMASCLNGMGLTVMEEWFVMQADEEHLHALRLIDYVQKSGGHVRLGAIEAPPSDFASPLQVVQKTYEHEKFVTARIHELVAQAEQDKDYSTRSSLQWYVDEQVEEEASVQELLQLTKLAGDQYLMLEHRVERLVAKRVAAAAAAKPNP